jgi:hypothetical protein
MKQSYPMQSFMTLKNGYKTMTNVKLVITKSGFHSTTTTATGRCVVSVHRMYLL